MTAVTQLTENFETGPDGASAVDASIFTNANATGLGASNFTSTYKVEGSFGCIFVQGADTVSRRVDLPAKSLLWYNYYIYVIAGANSATAINNFYSGTTKIGDFRFLAGGTQPNLRRVNTSVWTGTALATGAWHRIGQLVQPGSGTGVLRTRIYSGANLHTNTPSQDSGDQLSSAAVATVDNIRWGVISADTTLSWAMDRIRADDAAEPGGIVVASNRFRVDAALARVPLTKYRKA